MNRWLFCPVTPLLVIAAPVAAQGPSTKPAALSALMACRSLPDAERLACYDRQVTALGEAERKREVVIVDQSEVQRTRRSLFGLTLPSFKLLGNDDKDAPPFQQIETTLKAATRSGGAWLFTLDDGTNWLQTDAGELGRRPLPGQHIRIRKGAMGSYLANVEREPALRVRRLN